MEHFNDFTHLQKQKFIAEMVHLLHNDDDTFYTCQALIEMARNRGMFDKVRFLEGDFIRNE